MDIRWHVYSDDQAVAEAAAVWILRAAEKAVATCGTFRIVLAGGKTPRLTYRCLAEAHADWSSWQIYFGDERCLPPDHPDRNSQMASLAWLKQVAIPPENIHAIPAELGAMQGARQYQKILHDRFDVVILGMGEDGHTASLFPEHEYPQGQRVHAVFDAPKPPPERVSLSASALADTDTLLLLVTGENKRDALARWKAGENLPIAHIQAACGIDVMLDQDAAP